MNHFDEMACMLYLDRQLEPERARELIRHTSECSECRALLRSLEAESAWLQSALVAGEEPVPARLVKPPARARAHWGWIVAFGLAASGLYTLWNNLIAPWQQQISDAGINGSNLLAVLLFHSAFWKGWDSVQTLFEFVALATLITVVVGFSRRHWRQGAMAFLMGGLLCTFGMPRPASAGGPAGQAGQQTTITVGGGTVPSVHLSVKGAPNYTLPEGETHPGDLIAYADFVRINGDVQGDVIAFAQDVEINGHVEGDVIAFAEEMHITGQVDGNVRSYVKVLNISGKVARNVTVGCEIFQLSHAGSIGWGLMLGGKDADISGSIGRNVYAGTDDTEVNGTVGGNMVLRGSRLAVGSTADIKGSVRFRGDNPPTVAAGAKLASPVDYAHKVREKDYQKPHYWVHQILLWGAAFVLGLIVLVLAPGFFDRVMRACGQAGSFIGFLVLPGIPILAVIACITLVGIPVGIVGLLLWAVSLYAAQIFVAALIGSKLLGPAATFGTNLARLALGLLVIHAAELVPYVGGWICFLVIVWGMGAISVALFRSMRSSSTAAA